MASSTPTRQPNTQPAAQAATAGLGLGLVCYAVTNLTDTAHLLPPLLAATALLALLAGLAGWWRRRRARPVQDLRDALQPLLRPDTPDGLVRVRKRQKGVPVLLRITYPAAFDDRDEKKRTELREIVATRLGGSVEATWHPSKRQVTCRVTLPATATQFVESDTATSPAATDDTEEQARLRTRTTDVVQAIMGSAAHDIDIDFDGDAPERVSVSYATTSRDLSPAFRQKVILQLDSKLPGEWRDIWDLENDTVEFQLRPPFPTNVRYPLTHKISGPELPFAVTEYNQVESWKLGSKNPHCLVVGPTGSGKTVFIRNLVVGARLLGIPVVLCDPKMTEYLDFEHMDGVTLLTKTEEIAHAITLTHTEMMRRYRGLKSREVRKGEYGKVLFILDEFFVFKEQVQDLWQQMKAEDKANKGREHPCLSHWKQMVVLARTAEIHMVVGIQRPDSEFLTGLARDSFRMRVSLDQATPEAARMMWGNSRTGTDLPSVQGRCIATTDRGPEQLQVLRLLTPEDDADAFDAEDAAVWEQLAARMDAAAEMHAASVDGDPLGFLAGVHSSTRRALGQSFAPAVRSAAAPPAEPSDADAEEASGAGPGVAGAEDAPVQDGEEGGPAMELVGVYELEVGDRIVFESDGEVVEVTDLHFGEGEDGQETVDVQYSGPGGVGARELGMEAEVHRHGG